MEKINKLILAVIPNQKCNMKCEYCYISQTEDWKEECNNMKYSPEYIAKALSKERVGGTALVNLTGNGETLLEKNIVNIAECLLNEGHYVEIVTNATVRKRIEEILTFPPRLLDRLFFKISFHYKELKRMNMLDRFFETINLIKKRKVAFSLELMAYDGIEDEIENIRKICLENVGAVCQSTIGRTDQKKGRDLLTEHSVKDYASIWGKLDSPMLKFKLSLLGVKRREFCYAGYWSLFVDLYTGNAKACYRQPFSQNIYEDLSKPISFFPVGHYCLQPYCINGHAHLTWGLIPNLDTPCYLDMRNRLCNDGTQWIESSCNCFFKTKLFETNNQFSFSKKVFFTFIFPFFYIKSLFWSFNLNLKRLNKFRKIWKKI